MPHTFDVRFARSAGLAALLEAPRNTFRFKGAGRLSIHPEGITIAVSGGLASLCALDRQRRIDAARLREVYREGEALRFEFGTDESPRAVLPLWAPDPATAAQIVRLLPTTRTVEIEHSTVPPRRFRLDRRVPALAALVVAGAIGAWLWVRMPAVTAPPLALAPVTVEPVTEPVPVPAPERPARPTRFAPGSVAYAEATRALAVFETRSASLLDEYQRARADYEKDVISREQFIFTMRSNLELRWWTVTEDILRDPALADPALLEFRGALLAHARHWRNFLEGNARGLESRDFLVVRDAYVQLRRADLAAAQAAAFVR